MSTQLASVIAEAGALAVSEYKKRKLSQVDLSQESSLTVQSALDNVYMSSEQAITKRLPMCKYRLHPAKYLKADALFKDMFFPLRTLESSFGFTSITGHPGTQTSINNPEPSNDARRFAAAAGRWRGFASFMLRYTDETVNTNTGGILSADQQTVGGIMNNPTTSSPNDIRLVKSQYRSFHNSPKTHVTATASNPGGNADVPYDSDQQVVYEEFESGNNDMLVGRTALNLSMIERDAVLNMPYVPAPIARVLPTAQTAVAPNNTGPNQIEFTGSSTEVTNTDDSTPVLWQESDVTLGPAGVAPNTHYAQQFTQSIFRIADGVLEMDIANSDSTSCVVEVVINSMRKTPQDVNIPEFFKSVTDSVRRFNGAKISNNIFKLDPHTGSSASATTGGWQALYDPEYPLLKVPASTGKAVKEIATEVHRSNHVLAPGQSKVVKIALGSLYYTPESKIEYVPANRSVSGTGTVPMKVMNTGSLLVAIGHTGFNAFEAIIPDAGHNAAQSGYKIPSTYESRLSNTGFWAGKTRSPSSIIVSGNYKEKYYPMSYKPRNNIIRRNISQPSYFINGTDQRVAVPLESITGTRVATSTEEGTRSV